MAISGYEQRAVIVFVRSKHKETKTAYNTRYFNYK